MNGCKRHPPDANTHRPGPGPAAVMAADPLQQLKLVQLLSDRKG